MIYTVFCSVFSVFYYTLTYKMWFFSEAGKISRKLSPPFQGAKSEPHAMTFCGLNRASAEHALNVYRYCCVCSTVGLHSHASTWSVCTRGTCSMPVHWALGIWKLRLLANVSLDFLLKSNIYQPASKVPEGILKPWDGVKGQLYKEAYSCRIHEI